MVFSLVDLSIIVNWNTKDLLRNCLASIYQYTPKGEFEIFVADNASSDGSPEMVEAEFPDVKLIRNSENLGFAKANNQAIRLAQGRFVLLLNSDTEVLEGSIEGLKSCLLADSNTYIVGCQLINPGNIPEQSSGRFPSIITTCATKLIRAGIRLSRLSILASHYSSNDVRYVDWVTAACLLARKDALDSVGGFDENIFMYFEDADLCYRVKALGGRIAFLPNIKALHHRGASSVGDRNDVYRKSQIYFYKKHYGFFQTLILKTGLALSDQIRRKAR